MAWEQLLAGAATGGAAGGGYGGSSSQEVDVRTTVDAGKFGASMFDFSNRAFAPQSNWVLIGTVAGLALLAWLALRK